MRLCAPFIFGFLFALNLFGGQLDSDSRFVVPENFGNPVENYISPIFASKLHGCPKVVTFASLSECSAKIKAARELKILDTGETVGVLIEAVLAARLLAVAAKAMQDGIQALDKANKIKPGSVPSSDALKSFQTIMAEADNNEQSLLKKISLLEKFNFTDMPTERLRPEAIGSISEQANKVKAIQAERAKTLERLAKFEEGPTTAEEKILYPDIQNLNGQLAREAKELLRLRIILTRWFTKKLKASFIDSASMKALGIGMSVAEDAADDVVLAEELLLDGAKGAGIALAIQSLLTPERVGGGHDTLTSLYSNDQAIFGTVEPIEICRLAFNPTSSESVELRNAIVQRLTMAFAASEPPEKHPCPPGVTPLQRKRGQVVEMCELAGYKNCEYYRDHDPTDPSVGPPTKTNTGVTH